MYSVFTVCSASDLCKALVSLPDLKTRKRVKFRQEMSYRNPERQPPASEPEPSRLVSPVHDGAHFSSLLPSCERIGMSSRIDMTK